MGENKKIDSDKLIKIAILLILGVSIALSYNLIKARTLISAEADKYFPPWTNLGYVILSTFFCWVFKGSLIYLTCDPITRIYKKQNKKSEEFYLKKIINYIPNMIWYIIMVILGYGFVGIGNKRVPDTLGGSLRYTDKYFSDWPKTTYNFYESIYFYLQFGYKLFSLFETLFFKRNIGDFWEMIFHHLMACVLMFLSYFINWWDFGIVILLIHDPGDLSVVLAKVYQYIVPKRMKHTLIDVVLGITCLTTFILPRVFIQIFSIFWRGFNNVYIDNYLYRNESKNLVPLEAKNALFPIQQFMFLMLALLSILNLYWSYIMLTFLFAFFSKREIKTQHGYIKKDQEDLREDSNKEK